MHALALVVIPAEGEVESAVKVAMEPYSEHHEDDGWWDWWQIGGRFTGTFTGYDPCKDDANKISCWLCHGTGVRTDMRAENGCNGCKGTGIMTQWPTQFARYDGDVIPVAEYLAKCKQGQHFSLVTPDGDTHRERWYDEDWHEHDDFEGAVLEALTPYRDHRLVAVDYHS